MLTSQEMVMALGSGIWFPCCRHADDVGSISDLKDSLIVGLRQVFVQVFEELLPARQWARWIKGGEVNI